MGGFISLESEDGLGNLEIVDGEKKGLAVIFSLFFLSLVRSSRLRS